MAPLTVTSPSNAAPHRLIRDVEFGPGVVVVRSMMSVPAHMGFAALWGYGLARAAFLEPRKRPMLTLAPFIVVAALCHAAFNLLVLTRQVLGALVGAMLLSRAALAQQQQLKAPGFPDAPGKETLLAKCFQCHSAGMWIDRKSVV